MPELIYLDDAVRALLKEQEDDIEAYGCPIPEGFDGDRAVRVLSKLPAVDTDLSEYSERLWKLAYERGKAEGMMSLDTNIPIIEQIRWERDTAIAQLSQIGKGLGERMDDVEKVVRCKDCTNFTQGKDEWGSCFENPMKMWRDTDYCSWAERRTDETD